MSGGARQRFRQSLRRRFGGRWRRLGSFLAAEEFVRGGVREFFELVETDVIGVVGEDLEEPIWEVAVVGTGEEFAARAALHVGDESVGGPAADDVGVFTDHCFVMASEGVGVAALFEGGSCDRAWGGFRGIRQSLRRRFRQRSGKR